MMVNGRSALAAALLSPLVIAMTRALGAVAGWWDNVFSPAEWVTLGLMVLLPTTWMAVAVAVGHVGPEGSGLHERRINEMIDHAKDAARDAALVLNEAKKVLMTSNEEE